MILQDFDHLRRYLEACDYVFEVCGVKDVRKQGLLFMAACQYRRFEFMQVLQKLILDIDMYETCGNWSKAKNALLDFSKRLASGDPKILNEYAYLCSKEDDEIGDTCTRLEVLKIVHLNFQWEEAHLGNNMVEYALLKL